MADAPTIALVTYAAQPTGEDDDKLLAGALTRLGADVTFACWDDPAVQWAALDLAVIRSTWDYHQRIEAFLGWVDYVGAATQLVNDARTIRWNAHKGYLVELAGAGVPVVPTAVVRRGERFEVPDGDWVVKPAVSIGADRTLRRPSQAEVDALTATTDVLVQPFVADVETGETSVVCIDGLPSHALHKVPAVGDFRTQEQHGATVSRVPLVAGLEELARRVVALLPDRPAYARVDVVETADGPLLMELELIEPYLWFALHPQAADELAAVLLSRLR